MVLTTKLKEVQTENEGLKNDLETLKSLCMENDERVKYYQQMESKLQECMSGAMLQVIFNGVSLFKMKYCAIVQ